MEISSIRSLLPCFVTISGLRRGYLQNNTNLDIEHKGSISIKRNSVYGSKKELGDISLFKLQEVYELLRRADCDIVEMNDRRE